MQLKANIAIIIFIMYGITVVHYVTFFVPLIYDMYVCSRNFTQLKLCHICHAYPPQTLAIMKKMMLKRRKMIGMPATDIVFIMKITVVLAFAFMKVCAVRLVVFSFRTLALASKTLPDSDFSLV